MTDPSPENVRALHEQRDWLLVTLSSIGDAVITTDAEGRVTFLNPVAESLTGWTQEAVGQPLDGVIRILNEESRQPVESPDRPGVTGRPHSQAGEPQPAHRQRRHGATDQRQCGPDPQRQGGGRRLSCWSFGTSPNAGRRNGRWRKPLSYADDIIATLREPFVVLDGDLRVKTANRSFYDSFHVSKEETENRLVYDLGNGQWDIPGLRKLLDEVLSRNQVGPRLRGRTLLPGLSVERPCCSTPGHSRRTPNTRS